VRTDKTLSVFKYFDLADRFLRVRVLEATSAELRAGPGMTRSDYRRSVIRACLEEFEQELEGQLHELHPCDPAAAEDHLYQLCVAVNPGLEIHAVSLVGEEADAAAPETCAETARSGGREELFARLGRRVQRLPERLRERVVGQDDAIDRLVAAVRRAAAGLCEDARPLSSFLFVGRTGTGKTELARSLARELFDDERAFVRIDCSEFAMAHEYSKLIGAPPGYVGHGDGGQLTEALRRSPEAVVLFDEIEKAHPRLHNLLLQILDEGHLTDSKGSRVRFDRAFVILTSNAGAQDVQERSRGVGFQPHEPLGDAVVREITARALERMFSPEFLGRIDDTVPFRALDPVDARRIARLQLVELACRVRSRGLRTAFTPAVARWVAERGFREESGAREIRRVVRREIETPLADALSSARRANHRWVRVGIRGGEPVFRAED